MTVDYLGRVKDWKEIPEAFKKHVEIKLTGLSCIIRDEVDWSRGRPVKTGVRICETCEISWTPERNEP